MDHLIDDAAQEILLHLPLKHLIRFRLVSRRYNAMILSPGFIARHGQLHSPCASGGVFLHHARRQQLEPPPGGGGTPVGEPYACFVAASSTTSSPAMPAFHDVDLAGFLPRPNAREIAYLQRTSGATDAATARSDVFIVHSSAGHGLLLCCRGRVSPVHYYVCDPVARRFARLPELPRPPANEQSGLLSVAADEDGGGAATAIRQFQVILFDQCRQWDVPGGTLDLEVFSSNSGEWTPLRVPYPPDFTSFQCSRPPLLTQRGTAAYWLAFWPNQAAAYSSVDHSLRLIRVPHRAYLDTSCELNYDRCIGERRGGGLRYAHFNGEKLEVWETPPPGDEPPRWTLKHWAAANGVVRRSPGVGAFCKSSAMLRWMASNHRAFWRSLFTLVGFDPADEDVVLLEAQQLGRLAAYSMKQRKLSFRCELLPGVTFAPFDMFPYVRQPRGVAVEVPGMLSLDA